MNYNALIQTAKKIPAAGAKAIAEYKKKSDVLVAAMNHYMQSRPDLTALIGRNNISMMKSNHTNQVLFVHSILKNPNPEVLADTLLWVFSTYHKHGFKTDYWFVQMDAWFQIFKDHLSAETFVEIIPLYDWIRINIPTLAQLSVSSGNEQKLLSDSDYLPIS